jgi:hypothetical protein
VLPRARMREQMHTGLQTGQSVYDSVLNVSTPV